MESSLYIITCRQQWNWHHGMFLMEPYEASRRLFINIEAIPKAIFPTDAWLQMYREMGIMWVKPCETPKPSVLLPFPLLSS